MAGTLKDTIRSRSNIYSPGKDYFMNIIKNHKFLKILALLSFILIFSCALKKDQPDEIILAKIGDKIISVNEFMSRSELTIRPNDIKNKNATLNNLICEKILATEAENDNKFLNNVLLQGRLRGIQEQLMRDQLYIEAAFKKVQLDTVKIRNAYRASIREYEVEFYMMQNKKMAQRMETLLDSVPELTDDIFQELEAMLGKKPVHKVNYEDSDDEVIHESLFEKPLEQGTVVGPLKLRNGNYIVMKILDWIDYPLISGVDQQCRLKNVKEKLHKTEARKLWNAYRTNIMKGKKIQFDKESFTILSNWAMEKHLSENNYDTLNFQLSEIPPIIPEIDLNAPFFTIDHKLWTVGDFKNELISNPLVFRTKYLNENNFREQFKFAIADMMRDYYLTRKAYKKSMEDFREIKKTMQMWKDAYLADQQKNHIIHSAITQGIITENDEQGISRYWESYLFNLQKEYSDLISINVDEFKKLSLTEMDYFALRTGVPYPAVVPRFPALISSDTLNYIKHKQNL